MKGTRNKNIFALFFSKLEMNEKISCAHCAMDILARKGVICNFCEGSFHQGYTITSDWLDRSEWNFTCYKCYNFKLTEKKGNILKAPLKKSFEPLHIDNQVQDDHLPSSCKVEEYKRNYAQLFDGNACS